MVDAMTTWFTSDLHLGHVNIIRYCERPFADVDEMNHPARLRGRVTANPLAHLDPMGTVMMLVTVVTGFGIGWGKPVPVSPHRLRYGPRRGTMLVALAGPLSNLLIALLFGLALRWLGRWMATVPVVGTIVRSIVVTNIVIALFNLLPIPPLDGHTVLLGLLSFSQQGWAYRITQFIESWARNGWVILFGLIILSQLLGLNIIGLLIGPASNFLYRLFAG